MTSYKITITQTRTLETWIEADSPTSALIVAAQELRDNGSELREEDWNLVQNCINCNTEEGQMFIVSSK